MAAKPKPHRNFLVVWRPVNNGIAAPVDELKVIDAFSTYGGKASAHRCMDQARVAGEYRKHGTGYISLVESFPRMDLSQA